MNDARGSIWRKWDLHVHTPASIVHEYGGDNEEIWQRFVDELEALPPEIKVLGINDYIFIDCYRRLRQEKQSGRLGNLALLLPVIELRLDKFGGTAGHLSKVNFHVIFSDEIDPDIIQNQFINALYTSFRLNPPYESLQSDWTGVPNRQSLADLGQLIIASVPDAEKEHFGSPLSEGFNNLTFQIDRIHEILRFPYFRGKCLTAVGKTEWWNIKWNEQSIADKKTIINNAHFVFISAENVGDCHRAKAQLSASRVNDRLLDCSDAHRFSDSSYKDRIGKCYSWVKADPTFRGLVLAFYEPEGRIFLGDTPPKLEVVQSNRTKYIRSVSICKKSGSSLPEAWYENADLTLNHDLVAIIGNRGMGKSALAEVLGLLGNTRNDEYFSFLCTARFRKPTENKSEHFEGTLTWESGTSESRTLNMPTDHNLDELVKYIPQGFFETVCNEVTTGEASHFYTELKKVIFSHVELADRLGHAALDDLLAYKTDETTNGIAQLRSNLHEVNQEIIALEERLEEDYRLKLENLVQLKTRELKAHEAAKPAEVAKPSSEPNAELEAFAQHIDEAKELRQQLSIQLGVMQSRKQDAAHAIAAVEKVSEQVRNFQRQFKDFRAGAEIELERLGIKFEDIVQLTVDTGPLDLKYDEASNSKQECERRTDSRDPNSLTSQIQALDTSIKGFQSKLDEPSRQYESYVAALQRWEKRRDEIIGDEHTPESEKYYAAQLAEIPLIPARLQGARERRAAIIKEIYERIGVLADTYRKLYAPVQQFIDVHPIARDVFQMEFGVSIVNVDFHKRLFDWIGRNVVGSFYGSDEGEKKLRRILEHYDLNTEPAVLAFLDDVMDHLTHDKRDITVPKPVKLAAQLKKDRDLLSFYDYVFGLQYLQPRYVLRLSGKELEQLSPGERGILLLAFYLLIDKDDIPLIIDQPEENLDNQTLYEFLVNCIKEAKERRQIIIVTHNPNIAVVCDAEQFIYCTIDKLSGNRMMYQSGSIENPDINQRIVDILEGTKPAFNNRKLKYEPPIMAS